MRGKRSKRGGGHADGAGDDEDEGEEYDESSSPTMLPLPPSFDSSKFDLSALNFELPIALPARSALAPAMAPATAVS